MSKNCEECLALTMLLENNLIGNDAKISDCPDIISEEENVEVTSAIADKIENRLNFGKLPKDKEYTDLSNYDCNTCKFLSKCKEESKCDLYVHCEQCKDIHFWIKDDFINVSKGTVYYHKDKHPWALYWSESAYGSPEDLEKAIKRKERKSENYDKKNLGLFLYYNKRIDKMVPITSSIFKNIYVYCLDDGLLYKNWELIKSYNNLFGHTICYNTKCNEYGKFNN